MVAFADVVHSGAMVSLAVATKLRAHLDARTLTDSDIATGLEEIEVVSATLVDSAKMAAQAQLEASDDG